MRFPKLHLLRSRPYRFWIATLPCFACGIEGWSQAAHPNQAKYGKGGAMKAGDQYCFPLCTIRPGHMGCHYMHDQCIGMTKEERDAKEDEYVSRAQALALKAGRREIAQLLEEA